METPALSPFGPYHCPGLVGLWTKCPSLSPPDAAPTTLLAMAGLVLVAALYIVGSLLLLSYSMRD